MGTGTLEGDKDLYYIKYNLIIDRADLVIKSEEIKIKII